MQPVIRTYYHYNTNYLQITSRNFHQIWQSPVWINNNNKATDSQNWILMVKKHVLCTQMRYQTLWYCYAMLHLLHLLHNITWANRSNVAPESWFFWHKILFGEKFSVLPRLTVAGKFNTNEGKAPALSFRILTCWNILNFFVSVVFSKCCTFVLFWNWFTRKSFFPELITLLDF